MRGIGGLMILGALALMTACGNRSDSQTAEGYIARPRAYPRAQLYDTVYTDSGLPSGFLINVGAKAIDVTPPENTQRSTGQWIDIRYPAYGATLHCTFTPVTDTNRNDVASNRMERMMLNIGDNFADQTELSSAGGFHSTILMTGAETPTPVQFLSIGRDWVVSGALRFSAERVATDSVMPILEAVRADLIHAAKNL